MHLGTIWMTRSALRWSRVPVGAHVLRILLVLAALTIPILGAALSDWMRIASTHAPAH